MPANFEIRHLRYFIATAEAGSLSAAASQLYISQPPLTRQIHQLETLLRVKLFNRKPKGVELTSAGEVFLDEAKNILALIDQAAIRTKQAWEGQIGRIDVGIFGSAIYGVIPEIIRSFRNEKPGVEIVLHNMERSTQLKALREKRLSIGFNRFFGDEPDLQWERVHSESLNLALYKEHPFSSKKSIKLSEIADEPLILYPKTARPGFIDFMLKVFHKEGISPNITYEVDDVNTAVALASSGIGLSIVTQSACNLKLPNICYIPIEFSDITPFDLDAIYRKDDNSALLMAFLETVREYKQKYSKRPIITPLKN
jgi:DNA-binding transcriptional LysR family regulator